MKTGLLNVPQALNRLLASSTVKAAQVLTGPAALVMSIGFGALAIGCNEGGVGDPCIPEDEYQVDFAGYSEKEVNVESRSFQCETRVCLVNKFRGRVSCKYGGAENECLTPDGRENVTVAVDEQLLERRPIDAVYCSCRCAGINGAKNDGAPYCECPDGFSCTDLIKDWELGNKQLAGSYCVKNGTERTPESIDTNKICKDNNCNDKNDPYN